MEAENQYFLKCTFFGEKQRYVFAINGKLTSVFVSFFSQPQEIVDLSSWGVVNLLDPGFRSKLEKQNGGRKSIFHKMHFFRRKTEV